MPNLAASRRSTRTPRCVCTTSGARLKYLSATSFVCLAPKRQSATTQVQLAGVSGIRPPYIVPLCLTQAPAKAKFDSPCAAFLPRIVEFASYLSGLPASSLRRDFSQPLAPCIGAPESATRALRVSQSDWRYLWMLVAGQRTVTVPFLFGMGVTSSCRPSSVTAHSADGPRLARARKE